MKDHRHHHGLIYDLQLLRATLDRRQVLGLFAVGSLAPLVGCSSNSTGAQSSADGAVPAGDGSGATGCATIPSETAGPYPGDGSNGPNALTVSGVVRSDIRSSIGALSGTAEGVPLTVKLTVVDAKGSCAPLAGYAVYLWHCDRDGQYSLYTIVDQNYLRGVQETDADGVVTFTTIFPGCYSGRMPHIHFEVYPSVAEATASGTMIKVSQLGLFSDGTEHQIATVTGDVASGYVAELTVGVEV